MTNYLNSVVEGASGSSASSCVMAGSRLDNTGSNGRSDSDSSWGSDSTLHPDVSHSASSSASDSEGTLHPDLEEQPLLTPPLRRRPPFPRHPRRQRPPPGEFDGLFSEPCFISFCAVVISLFLILFVPVWWSGAFDHTVR